MNMSESVAKLADALSKAQAEIEGATKGKVNPAFRSKYADLASVWDAIRAPLTKHGIAVVQAPDMDAEGRTMLRTTVMHSSGEWISSSYPVNPVKADPQGMGSATTYARRYSLMAMIGVCPEDDDGNAASGKSEPPREREAPPAQKVAPPPADDTGFWGRESLEIPVARGDYGAWSERIKKAIDAAPDLPKINKLMSDNGAHLVAFERDEKAGAAFIKDRAAKRRAVFAQGEVRDA